MRFVLWVFRILLFGALFAFALNNRHEVVVFGFFGTRWTTPLVMLVLAALLLGCALGIVAMAPSWWRRARVQAPRATPAAPPASREPTPTQTESL